MIDNDTSTMRRIAILAVAEARIGLDADILMEVMPAPAVLDPWPAADSPVCGTLMLRQTPIPVIDLRQHMGFPAAQGDRVIAVLQLDQGLLGLLADSAAALAQIPQADFSPFQHGDGDEVTSRLISHGVHWAGRIVHMISPERLVTERGIRLAAPPLAKSRHARADHALNDAMLLFDMGGHQFALPALAVEAILPMCDVHALPIEDAALVGLLRQPQRDVPVLNMAALCGLDTDGTPAPQNVVVVLLDDGKCTALAADRIVSIDKTAGTQRTAVSSSALAKAAPINGVFLTTGGDQYLLIDLPALSQMRGVTCATTGIARAQDTRLDRRSNGARAEASQPLEAFLIFDAAGMRAMPLAAIREVIAYPARMAATAQTDRHILGTFAHRGQHIVLKTLMAREPDSAPDRSNRVLLLEGANIGYLTTEVYAIQQARRTKLALPTDYGHADAALSSGHVIYVTVRGERRTVPVLDSTR